MSPISSSTALPETWEDGYSFHYNIRWSPEKNLIKYMYEIATQLIYSPFIIILDDHLREIECTLHMYNIAMEQI